ncbi:MAG: DsrE family protein, partial [Planctomycetota bacterium]
SPLRGSMTEVIVIVQKTPFNTLRNSEGLRMSVGLTLEDDNKITVLFIDDGVHLLRKTNPGLIQSGIIFKHLDALRLLGHRVVADKESLEKRGIKELGAKADILPRDKVIEMLTSADRVIPWQ